MSGSAALSAARKRRASTAPSANIGSPSPSSYYNRGPTSQVTPSFQNEPPQNYIQSYPHNIPNGIPPQPMNIYENIELIKHQLVERTKLIQTQGSSIPVEKLRVLQKQNEIQTQILKQKMAIAKQMEMSEKQQPEIYERRGPVSIQSLTEPEFIYEKGVPLRNPKYKTLSDATPNAVMHTRDSSRTRVETSQLTPFVSMLSDTGVIPPPVVVLKSHDAKLEEHNHILHDIVHQLDELHSKLKNKSLSSDSERNASSNVKFQASKNDNADNDDDNDNDDDETDEELLMDVVMNDLTNSREFVEGIVNKIVNETNLSEVIMKIEPLVKENQELRSLIHSQQQMMNEMNTMLFRLLNKDNAKLEESQSQPEKDITTYQVGDGLDGDGLYQPEMTEIVLTHYDRTHDVEHKDINNTDDVTVEVIVDSTAAAATSTATTDPVPTEAETAACSVPLVDQDEEYSMPHFPEPISLVVSDI